MDREQFLERTWPWLRRLATGGAWASLAACLLAWAILLVADWHWLGTLAAFGPRWMLLLPVVAAAILAAFWRPKSLWPVACGAVVVVGPVMGLSVPWRKWTAGGLGKNPGLRVITCNIGGRQDLLPLVQDVQIEQVELVACQEWPTAEWPLPESEWHVARQGNLLIASRWPLKELGKLNSQRESWRTLALACEVQTDTGPVRVGCVHLPTPRPGVEAMLHRGLAGAAELDAINELRREESAAVRAWIADQRIEMLLGDFNLPQESRIYQGDWGSWRNAFVTAGWGYGWSKYTRWHGVRIDHILCREGWRPRACWVGRDVGSDHWPVMAEVNRN